MDWDDILTTLNTAARAVGAEITAPWFYVQAGIILQSHTEGRSRFYRLARGDDTVALGMV